jgi:hypothetical protein
MSRMLMIAAVLSLGASAANAQQAVTVKSLLAQDFAVVGSITSNAGPGVFLQKKDKLFLCFVAETPNSTAVATRYCKPVE